MRRLPHLFFKTTILTDDNKLIIQTILTDTYPLSPIAQRLARVVQSLLWP